MVLPWGATRRTLTATWQRVGAVPKRKPPSRLRYEKEHPSLTVRVPAAVKAAELAAAQAEDPSVSEWVQAMAAGHAAKAADAYRRGQEVGKTEGEAAGYQRGRAEGEQVAGKAGFRAGVLASSFAAEDGRSYDPATLARRLLEDPDQRTIAERLIPAAPISAPGRACSARRAGAGSRRHAVTPPPVCAPACGRALACRTVPPRMYDVSSGPLAARCGCEAGRGRPPESSAVPRRDAPGGSGNDPQGARMDGHYRLGCGLPACSGPRQGTGGLTEPPRFADPREGWPVGRHDRRQASQHVRQTVEQVR